jgi:hypothetical protein
VGTAVCIGSNPHHHIGVCMIQARGGDRRKRGWRRLSWKRSGAGNPLDKEEFCKFLKELRTNSEEFDSDGRVLRYCPLPVTFLLGLPPPRLAPPVDTHDRTYAWITPPAFNALAQLLQHPAC